MKYGKLTFIRDVEPPKYKNQSHKYGLWKCDCGKEKVIVTNDVIRGSTRSCGCASQIAMRKAIARQYAAFRIDQKNKGVA